jgi:hypothetical protein
MSGGITTGGITTTGGIITTGDIITITGGVITTTGAPPPLLDQPVGRSSLQVVVTDSRRIAVLAADSG